MANNCSYMSYAKKIYIRFSFGSFLKGQDADNKQNYPQEATEGAQEEHRGR